MSSRQRGFTLVEVVVALTILSLVIAATLTAMRTLALTQTRLDARTEEVARLRAVSDFLYRSISQAQPLQVFLLGSPEGYLFYGNQDELYWAAPVPVPAVEGGLLALRLFLSEDRELGLQIRESADLTPWSEESSYRLTDNVEQMQIQYRNSSEDQWVSEWLMAPDRTLPSHVKISLKVDGRYWPEIIIPVRGW